MSGEYVPKRIAWVMFWGGMVGGAVVMGYVWLMSVVVGL